VRLSRLVTPSASLGDGDGGIVGMRIGSGNRNTRRNRPQIHFVDHKSHMNWCRTRDSAMGTNHLSYATTLFLYKFGLIWDIDNPD
jgi:hypothetical protein